MQGVLKSSKRVFYKYPNLAIHADGTATIDETGSIIGNIKSENLSHAYYDYVAGFKLKKIRNIFDICADNIGVSVDRISVTGLNTAGKLLKINNRYVVITKSELSALFSEIIAIHELSHIATNTVDMQPNEISSADYLLNERIANEWVLKRFISFLPQSKSKFLNLDLSSDSFYQTLLSEIERDFYIF